MARSLSLAAWVRTGSALVALGVAAGCAGDTAAPAPEGAVRARSVDSLATITDIAARVRHRVLFLEGPRSRSGRLRQGHRALVRPRLLPPARRRPGHGRDRQGGHRKRHARRDQLVSGRVSALGMDNSNDGADTLRHVFALLMGLGMRESSGVYVHGPGPIRDQYQRRNRRSRSVPDQLQRAQRQRLDEQSVRVAPGAPRRLPRRVPRGRSGVQRGESAELRRGRRRGVSTAREGIARLCRPVHRGRPAQHPPPLGGRSTGRPRSPRRTRTRCCRTSQRAIEADPTELCRELL